MANGTGVSNIPLKLEGMTLKDDTCYWDEKSESNDKKNLLELNLNLSCFPDTKLETQNDCSEFTFDNVIGHLEDMLIDENFYKLQNSFLEKHWQEFEDSEENKHSYMTIFNDYTNKIEDFIVEYLKGRIANFDMDVFALELEKRKETLEGEIFEVLLTLSDFSAFKEIFLDYRAMKEGHTIDLGKSLSVSSIPL